MKTKPASQAAPARGLLTVAEAARRAGISRQAIEQAIARGALEAVTVDVPVHRVRPAALARYIEHTGGSVGRPPAEDE